MKGYWRLSGLTLVLRRGLLQPPKIKKTTNKNKTKPKKTALFLFLFCFVFNYLRQTRLCNYLYIYYAYFDVYEVKFGCVVWILGSSKIMVEGVGEIPWFLFRPFHKYFTRYMLQTCYVDEKHHFLHNQPKILQKSHISAILFSEKLNFANFYAYLQYIQICVEALTLWRHMKFNSNHFLTNG